LAETKVSDGFRVAVVACLTVDLALTAARRRGLANALSGDTSVVDGARVVIGTSRSRLRNRLALTGRFDTFLLRAWVPIVTNLGVVLTNTAARRTKILRTSQTV